MAAKKQNVKQTARRAKVVEVSDASDELEGSAPSPATPPTKRARGKAPVDLAAALVHAYATNERIHQYLLEHLDPSAWSAIAPVGKGRTIRRIVAHLHNVRHLWLSTTEREVPAPPKVDAETLTLEEARLALHASGTAMTTLLRKALDGGGHLKDFKPDVVAFAAYAISHEAHHRGQICLLARMLGKPLSQAAGYGLWEWRKRAEELD